jgi:kynurenine formamidase
MSDLPEPPELPALPAYRDLPPAPDGGRSGWGLFGPDDSVGLLNLQTPDKIVAAARLIRKGAVFPLDAPVDAIAPPLAASRGIVRHRVLHAPGTFGFDDVYDNVYPQVSSQWDSLAHVGYAPDAFYNGATEDDILAGRRNTIEHWARRGIAGRAVLLDLERTLGGGDGYDLGTSLRFSVADLEAARARAGVEIRPGDVLLLHTGFGAWYAGQDARTRQRLSRELTVPGIANGEPMCEYLWDLHIAAIASDTFAVEAFPVDRDSVTGFLHRMLIGQFGMALGELWRTDALAADCAADGVSEMFLTAAPWHAPGGIGSPANAIAIK